MDNKEALSEREPMEQITIKIHLQSFTCHSWIDTLGRMRFVFYIYKALEIFLMKPFHLFNRIFHLIFLLPLTCASVYVPGTPGAPWSQDELLIVKSKLYALFNKNEDIRAPVMLRLGFHDCLKYADGSGGCDGCLNWEGVGYRYPNLNNFTFANVDRSNTFPI